MYSKSKDRSVAGIITDPVPLRPSTRQDEGCLMIRFSGGLLEGASAGFTLSRPSNNTSSRDRKHETGFVEPLDGYKEAVSSH